MIVIIDYGMGNLRSIQNKLKKAEVENEISFDKNVIEMADKLILPGVGNFKMAIDNLNKLNIIEVLNQKVIKEKVPILGICLGLQLFAKNSEEGNCEGLGWIDSEVVRFNVSDKIKYKVPHIGWNNVTVKNSNSMDKSISISELFYFVHSYHIKCNNTSDIWMTSKYDYEFVSAIHRDNIYGMQFHPEKSHNAGLEILKKFVEI